ncbi:glycosyltransferase family 2 protein [Thermus amyloliquefaciens]|uniref:glycosyltransferase family 2 protein n=1 Tax=Thermus amyloliquefaciens TaxID=1449080 RepID=UPI0009E00EC9|nr:glycosyltransferase family 2 protein [Thermus amyloliquefaciens]
MDRVCAVIVTYNRKELLRECLKAVLSQTRPPDHVLVVDNASTDGTPEMLREEFPQVEVLRLPENQGGAGGFHEGMKRAYEAGYEWIWLMDDDTLAYPETLERLLQVAEREGLDAVGPLPLSSENETELAYPHHTQGGLTWRRQDLEGRGLILGEASFFLGVLVARGILAQGGFPDKRLFIRGDEVEYGLRLKGIGGRLATLTTAFVRHPSFKGEVNMLLGRRLVVVYSGNPRKDFYNYRNRMHIFRLHRRPWWFWVALDILRHTWFFLLVRRGDWKGWRLWWKASLLGLRGNLIPYEEAFAREGVPSSPAHPRL